MYNPLIFINYYKQSENCNQYKLLIYHNMKKEKQFRIRCPPIDIICPPSYLSSNNVSFKINPSQQEDVILQTKLSDKISVFKQKTQIFMSTQPNWNKPVQSHEKFKSTYHSQQFGGQQKKKKAIRQHSPYIKSKKQFDKVMKMLKPVHGPHESIIQQIKKYNYTNHKTAQLAIMRRPDSFSNKIKKFSSRMGMPENAKIFIIISQDVHIKQALLEAGWTQNTNHLSLFFHLKWVCSDNPSDYDNLNEGQFFNHFKDNHELTNKYCLHKNISKANMTIKPNFPSTYTLQNGLQFKKFYEQFRWYNALATLRQLIQSIKLYNKDIFSRFNKNINFHGHYNKMNKKQSNSKLILEELMFQNYEELKKKDFSSLAFLQFCNYLASEIQKKKKISYSLFRNYDAISFNGNIFYLKQLVKNQQKARQFFTKELTNFILIELLKMYQHLANYFNASFGEKNAWIAKPVGVARGSGIMIIDSCDKISSKVHGKIIQKYIQKPLLLQCKRKFDIRQWVLITNVQPLQVYYFKNCYLRFSHQIYENGNYENLKKHLTNYSQNKASFINKQNSVKSQQEFEKNIGQEKWKILRQQMNLQIYKTLKCCVNKLEYQVGCFEIYGFDILIDQNYKPWILEVNLSPACEKRASFLQTYLKEMSEGIIDFIQGCQPRNWIRLDCQKALIQNQLKKKQQQAAILIQKFWKAKKRIKQQN